MQNPVLVFLAVTLPFTAIRADDETKLGAADAATAVPDNCRQLIVATCEGWSATRGKLVRFERESAQAAWNRVEESEVDIMLGRKGLAWGRGLIPPPQSEVAAKVEKDGKCPAGCFSVGKLHGYAPEAPGESSYPYNQVTAKDCWVDDPENPHYNQHIEIDLENPPTWYPKQRMRLNDPTYEWLLEINHNQNPPKPAAGSAIFFHIIRAPDLPSVGCTVMERRHLLELLLWIDAEKHPCYVLLPDDVYAALREKWNLPDLAAPQEAEEAPAGAPSP